MPADQWEQYAEKAPPAGSDPWAQYAEKSEPSAASPIAPPAIQKPSVSMHPSYLLGDPEKDATPESLGDVAKGIGKNLYQVSAPGIATSILNKRAPGIAKHLPTEMTKNATPIEHLPAQMIENFALSTEPGPDAAPGIRSAETPRIAPPRARPVAPAESPGVLGRVGEVAVRRAGDIPGVKAVKDLDYIIRGPKTAPKASAVSRPEATPIPETDGIPWGSGGQWPLELRGRRIPEQEAAPGSAGSLAESVADKTPAEAAPAIARSKATTPRPIVPEKMSNDPTSELNDILDRAAAAGDKRLMRQLEEGLNEGLGAKPLRPNVPLRDQLKPEVNDPTPQLRDALDRAAAARTARTSIPEGHTATPESSAIRSYKYDPVKREIEAVTTGGQHYVYGDVSPEAADKFISAPSKGTAWKELRSTPGVTQVAKHINAQRMATQPPVALRSASPDDLEPEWTAARDDLRAKKAARIAKPN